MTPKKFKVYFMQNGRPDLIKIGKATNVERRRKDLDTASPDRIKVVAVREGYREADLHHRFQIYRLNRKKEWFRYSNEIKQFLADSQQPFDEHSPDEQVVKLVTKVRKWQEEDKKHDLDLFYKPRWPRFLKRSFGLIQLRHDRRVNEGWNDMPQHIRNKIVDYLMSPQGSKHFSEWLSGKREGGSTVITQKLGSVGGP